MDETDIKIIENSISRAELETIAKEQFGDFVKAVVDIERKIMAIGGELHADEEVILIKQGSDQKNLWGINLRPGTLGDDWIEFNSMINIRPSQGNRSRSIESKGVRDKIRIVVDTLTYD